MEITQADEGEQMQADDAVARGLDRVADADAVALPDELEFLENTDILNEVFPAGGLIELKALEEAFPARVEGVAELVDGQFDGVLGSAIQVNQFADAVQGHDPPDRREGGGTQEAVITAGIASDDSGRCERSHAIGQQPFIAQERMKLASGFDRIKRHERSVIQACDGG